MMHPKKMITSVSHVRSLIRAAPMKQFGNHVSGH